ncbi:MAG: ribosome recycling factor [Candidatus Liptonbacteria bacterium]|nr:ribosome recycling factor [Candidatus Liptonbacteria bacterium]
MNTEDFLKQFESELKTSTEKLKSDLAMIRSNRPSVELIEGIKVSLYEQMLSIQELGSISLQPPRDILISVWDKNAAGAVAKAIEDAKIGLSVSSDGNVIRASLPILTEERKAELSKLVKKTSEETRIQIRTRRDEAMKKIKAAQDSKDINKDQEFKVKEKIQKQVENTNDQIEKLLEGKLKEIGE